MKQYTFGFQYANGISTISSGLYFYAESYIDALKKICTSKNVNPSSDVIFIEAIELF
jgi:hypothetical protein